jgi:hypothetical protein
MDGLDSDMDGLDSECSWITIDAPKCFLINPLILLIEADESTLLSQAETACSCLTIIEYIICIII